MENLGDLVGKYFQENLGNVPFTRVFSSKKIKGNSKDSTVLKTDLGENSLSDENQQEKRAAQKGREDPHRDFVRENHGSGERIAQY